MVIRFFPRILKQPPRLSTNQVVNDCATLWCARADMCGYARYVSRYRHSPVARPVFLAQHSEVPDLCAGLDARAAAIVMRVVRNIVNTGRTIACTIHQPAIDIFEVSHLDQSSAPAVILVISDPAACL